MKRFHYPNLASAALVDRGPAGRVSAGLVMCRTASRPRSCRKPSKVTFVGAALCFFLRGRVRTTWWKFNSEQGAHGKNSCWDHMLSHWDSCWFASNSMVASNARPSCCAVQIPCGLVSSPLLLLPLAARPVLLHIPKSQASLRREHFGQLVKDIDVPIYVQTPKHMHVTYLQALSNDSDICWREEVPFGGQ